MAYNIDANGENCYKCPDCDGLYSTLRRLKRHRISCSNDVQTLKSVFSDPSIKDFFQCPYCDGLYDKVRQLHCHLIQCNKMSSAANEKVDAVVANDEIILLPTMPSNEDYPEVPHEEMASVANSECELNLETISEIENPNDEADEGRDIFICEKCGEVLTDAQYKEHSKIPCPVIIVPSEEVVEENAVGNSEKRPSSDTEQSFKENQSRKRSRPKQPCLETNQDLFFCDICEKYFSTKGTLDNHKRNIHENRNSFKCALCPKTLNYKQNLIIHILGVHTKIRPFQCDHCGFGAVRKFDHNVHLKRSPSCAKFSEENGNKATRIFSQEELTCPMCTTISVNALALMEHIKDHIAVHGSEKHKEEQKNSVEIEHTQRTQHTKAKGRNKIERNKKSKERAPVGKRRRSNKNVEIEQNNNELSGNMEIISSQEPPKCAVSDDEKTFEQSTHLLGILTDGNSIFKDNELPEKNSPEMRTALAKKLEFIYQWEKQVEENGEKYRCNLCSITCLSDKALEGHMKRHNLGNIKRPIKSVNE